MPYGFPGCDQAAEILQRQAVVAEARSWVGTPWAHRQRVKRAGVDCAWLLAEVYSACGLIPAQELGAYAMQWHLHRDEERYLDAVTRHARELADGALPQPGDVAVWRYGRTFSHGAIVTAWPRIIHAWATSRCVVEDDAEANLELAWFGDAPRPRRLFTLWERG